MATDDSKELWKPGEKELFKPDRRIVPPPGSAAKVKMVQTRMDLSKAAKIISEDGCTCSKESGDVCTCYRDAARAMMIGGAELLERAKGFKHELEHTQERLDKANKLLGERTTALYKAEQRIKDLERGQAPEVQPEE